MTEKEKVYLIIQLIGFIALLGLIIHYWYNEIYKKS